MPPVEASMKLTLRIAVLAVLAHLSPAWAQQPTGSVSLPNAAQRSFLEGLKKDERRPPEAIARVPVPAMPDDSIHQRSLQKKGRVDQPTHATDQAYILLDPALTPDQVRAKIEQYDLRVLNSNPQIGGLHVDISRLRQRLGTTAPAPDLRAGRLVPSPAIELLSKDTGFLAVTPNTVVTPHQIVTTVAKTPTLSAKSAVAAAQEIVDWGMVDAKITAVWPQLGGRAFKVGIIDVGFAAHEDLSVVAALVPSMPAHDHGNHVAGIACAQHNGKGLKGVVPNCTAAISTGSFVLDLSDPIEGVNTRFYGMFAELVATVLDFIAKNDDVKTINLSLGYNWMPNFNINPVDNQHAEIRDLVRQQGRIFLSILTVAREKGVAIVSAAGNDSRTLPAPTLAKWASPFNWAALTMRDLDGWTNGIVVEAHDQNGRRADFSNVGGLISAPGVDIYSAVATANNAYDRLSGTSMASPYVTGALTLLRSARPAATLRQSIECLLSSTTTTDVGTKKLDLAQALEKCPS
jgi:subtilisin family serine protease